MKSDLCYTLHDNIYMKHPEKANLEKQKNSVFQGWIRDGLHTDKRNILEVMNIF